MIDDTVMSAILESLRDPLVFVDMSHTIRYMNRAAIAHYSEGESLLGTSLLDCHNTQSQKMIIEIMEAMREGLEERLITDNETQRIYMRAVRDTDGRLLGYYERYEPPVPRGAAV
jgi:PAS domain-containing protein